jgi:hypothetical protein
MFCGLDCCIRVCLPHLVVVGEAQVTASHLEVWSFLRMKEWLMPLNHAMLSNVEGIQWQMLRWHICILAG